MILEICSNSLISSLNAEKAGADRIELCKDLHLDGLTPDYSVAKNVIDKINIPVFILIRPRDGDFVYSSEEFELMKNDIIKFKKMGCKGIVSGILNQDNSIDVERTRDLVLISKPLDFTFHRAFDYTKRPVLSLKILKNLGVKRILTSGQKSTAIQGIGLLEKLNKLSNDEITVMPGSGIDPSNVHNFMNINIKEIHASASKGFDHTQMNIVMEILSKIKR